MEYKRLGDICDVRDGTHDSPTYVCEGYPLVTSKNIIEGKLDLSSVNYISYEDYCKINERSKVDTGDIIMPMIGTIGNPYIVEEFTDFAIKNVALIKFNNKKINNKYIFYFLNSDKFKRYISKNNRGGTQKFLSLKDIRNLGINVPALNEQIEIISKFDKISNLISLRKQQLQQLDELVKARFVELMNSNPSHNFLSDFIVSYKAERCGNRELPVLSITKDDGIVLQNEKFKKRIASADASTYKIVPRGKLVQGIHIDERNFAIQNIVDEGIVSPAYKIWTVDTTKAIPEVLAFALRTDRTMSYISSKFTGSIKRRESISISDFMATSIDLPNMIVQNEFADFVKQIEKSKVVVQKALNEAQTLFDSLMQEYFG